MKKMLFFVVTIAMIGMLTACNFAKKSNGGGNDDAGCYEVTFSWTAEGEDFTDSYHIWFDTTEECDEYYSTIQQDIRSMNEAVGDIHYSVSMTKTGDSRTQCEEYDDYEY